MDLYQLFLVFVFSVADSDFTLAVVHLHDLLGRGSLLRLLIVPVSNETRKAKPYSLPTFDLSDSPLVYARLR